MLIELMKNARIGETKYDNIIADVTCGLGDEDSREFAEGFYQRAGENIRKLDDRLVWEPETSTLYWERTDDAEAAPVVDLETVEDAIVRAFEY